MDFYLLTGLGASDIARGDVCVVTLSANLLESIVVSLASLFWLIYGTNCGLLLLGDTVVITFSFELDPPPPV